MMKLYIECDCCNEKVKESLEEDVLNGWFFCTYCIHGKTNEVYSIVKSKFKEEKDMVEKPKETK